MRIKRRKGFVTYRVYAEPNTGTVCREQNPIELHTNLKVIYERV